MTKFQVTSKVDALVRGHESDGLEEHVGNWSSREHVACNQLVHDLGWYLLVGNGLEHGERDREDRGKEDTNDGGPDGELGWEDRNGRAEEGESDGTDDSVPPERNFRIMHHEAGVHVALLL